MPSFFYMQINDIVQDLESNRLLLTSTLIHEYCHFIQDITTNFGLSNIIKTCNINGLRSSSLDIIIKT